MICIVIAAIAAGLELGVLVLLSTDSFGKGG